MFNCNNVNMVFFSSLRQLIFVFFVYFKHQLSLVTELFLKIMLLNWQLWQL